MYKDYYVDSLAAVTDESYLPPQPYLQSNFGKGATESYLKSGLSFGPFIRQQVVMKK